MTFSGDRTQTDFSLEERPMKQEIIRKLSAAVAMSPVSYTHLEQCFTDLNKGKSPEWILEGDIKGCFDPVSYTHLNSLKAQAEELVMTELIYN